MPRLRNENTGAIMSVSESTAALLGSQWIPDDQAATPEPEPEPKRTRAPRRQTTN